ncbi:MAG TPA: anthranilate phosphoribosyltransferase [Dehalococcoidia bacterium]|nr:anthranilate phosphoribosyltransferase [Dehalococcoidia bacterium]
MIREALDALINHDRHLSEDEAAAVMSEVMAGEATPAQLGALLAALRLRGETVDEIAGMARIMRERALRVQHPGPLIDTCGTGGDGSGSFNVSTAAALVAAAGGVRVAKHGNRAMSSGCGSADVLEALGARIELAPEGVTACIDESNFGFMFAQAFHPAMKHAAPTRRDLGVRTVFNILGPLSNPAGAQAQVLGVPRPELVETMAAVLGRLGCRHALVVHGEDGIDELTLAGPTLVCELKGETLATYRVTPNDAGLEPAPRAAVHGGAPVDNAKTMHAVFEGRPGPIRDFVLLNAAAALIVGGAAANIAEGVTVAARLIDTGEAGRTAERFVEASQRHAPGTE